jgi:hypothetical protein
MSIMSVIVGTLAVWRATHLLHAEDGPWGIFARLRRLAGSGFWGQLLDCFYCLSLWMSIPVAALAATSWQEGALLWLALSGGAILLERATAPMPAYIEEPAEIE